MKAKRLNCYPRYNATTGTTTWKWRYELTGTVEELAEYKAAAIANSRGTLTEANWQDKMVLPNGKTLHILTPNLMIGVSAEPEFTYQVIKGKLIADHSAKQAFNETKMQDMVFENRARIIAEKIEGVTKVASNIQQQAAAAVATPPVVDPNAAMFAAHADAAAAAAAVIKGAEEPAHDLADQVVTQS